MRRAVRKVPRAGRETECEVLARVQASVGGQTRSSRAVLSRSIPTGWRSKFLRTSRVGPGGTPSRSRTPAKPTRRLVRVGQPPLRQTVETLDNIEAVIASALVAHPGWHGGNPTSKAALVKVYVRRPEHLPSIERRLPIGSDRYPAACSCEAILAAAHCCSGSREL